MSSIEHAEDDPAPGEERAGSALEPPTIEIWGRKYSAEQLARRRTPNLLLHLLANVAVQITLSNYNRRERKNRELMSAEQKRMQRLWNKFTQHAIQLNK